MATETQQDAWRVAFIGLGNMGGPMAANLVKAGHAVRGFDLSDAALARLTAAGGTAATSIADAVRNAQVVITMLPAGERAVVPGPRPAGADADKVAAADCRTCGRTGGGRALHHRADQHVDPLQRLVVEQFLLQLARRQIGQRKARGLIHLQPFRV